MICENCKKEHNGLYGSGRFCSERCARSYASNVKREERNEKISKSLKGRESWIPKENRKIRSFTEEERKKGAINSAQKRDEKAREAFWEGKLTGHRTIRKYLLEDQNNKCAICSIEPIWNNNILVFHVDHIDGNSSNFLRSNLQAICPNCHSQTKTYCGRNVGKGATREYLKNYLSYDERKKILSEKRLSELVNIDL